MYFLIKAMSNNSYAPFTFFLDEKSNKKIKAFEKKLKFTSLRYNG